MKKLPSFVIIGASGFGAEAAWIFWRMREAPQYGANFPPRRINWFDFRLAGFCDDDPAKLDGVFNSLPLLGSLESAAKKFDTNVFYFCAVGDNEARKKITARANALGWMPFSIIDPTAVVAPDATLGEGMFLGAHAVVSCVAHVGNHAIVNHNAVIGHNARVGDFTHICPGAKISGWCHIGEGAFLATNATVIPACRVGAWASVGAGAVVLRDLPERARLIPVPGRVLHLE